MPEIEKPTERFADTVIILGNTRNSVGEEPSLDQATRNALLAGQLITNSGLANEIVAISSHKALTTKYLGELGTDNPTIRDSKDEAKEIKKIIKNGEFGEIALITADGSSKGIMEDLEREGINIELITSDEEVGKRITYAHHDASTIFRAVRDFVTFRGIKNVRVGKLSLAHSS